MTDPFTITVQKFAGHPLVILLIALGGIFIVIAYSGGFIKFVYDYSQRHRVKAKQKYIEHCNSLFMQFAETFDRNHVPLNGSSFESYFNIFWFKEQFLQHLFTEYDQVFVSLISMINIDREIETSQNPVSEEQKQKSNRSHAEFKTAFESFRKDITLRTKTFGGVCKDCEQNYEKAYKTTIMTDKIKSFTMPF